MSLHFRPLKKLNLSPAGGRVVGGVLSGGAVSRPSPSSGVALLFTSVECCCVLSLPLGGGAFAKSFFPAVCYCLGKGSTTKRRKAGGKGRTAGGRGTRGGGKRDHHSIQLNSTSVNLTAVNIEEHFSDRPRQRSRRQAGSATSLDGEGRAPLPTLGGVAFSPSLLLGDFAWTLSSLGGWCC